MKRKQLALITVHLLGAFLFFSGCQKREINPNFILITLDTQRADFISAYSRDNASTPNIDSLANQGLLYENCFSLIPITLPSHASIFFSKPPHRLKNYNNAQIITNQRRISSFVNVFKNKGFMTAAFVSLGVLKAKFGLNQAFGLYQDEFPKERWYLTAEEINQRVFPWLEQHKDRKFFLWIHYSDPHAPYAPPDSPPDFKIFLNSELIGEYTLKKNMKHEITLNAKKGQNFLRFDVQNEYQRKRKGFLARFDKFEFSPGSNQKDFNIQFKRGWLIRRNKNIFFTKQKAYVRIDSESVPPPIKLIFQGKLIIPKSGIRELYKKEVEYMDREIGALLEKLKKLKLSKKTHLLLVGDHGEGLGEYKGYLGQWHIGHIHFLYEVYMKVPLIIYNPFATKKGIRREEPVTLLDLAPTIMEIMNFKQLPSFQGRNLLSPKKDEVTIFQETYKPEAFMDVFALLKFPWHLILTPQKRKYELYDLREDPEEKENIYQDIHLPHEVIDLRKKLDASAQAILKSKKEIKIDDKSKEMLRALGYIR
jgi:membrane-anchored protein YejM (alkaline phosphatase superfamily)